MPNETACYIVEGFPGDSHYGTIFCGHFHTLQEVKEGRWEGDYIQGVLIHEYDSNGKEIKTIRLDTYKEIKEFRSKK